MRRDARTRMVGHDPPAQPRLVTARAADDVVVGFVNVVTDGGDHAFLIDTKTRGAFQRQGIATRVVAFAAQHAKAAGCEWLHVDFDEELRAFYLDACGFEPTAAGLIHLRPRQAPG